MRFFLQGDRVQGARKIHRVWVVPVLENGLPRITKGKRGPEPTWKGKVRRPAAMNTVHINRHHLQDNRKSNNTDKMVISVQRSGKNLGTGYKAQVNEPLSGGVPGVAHK